METEKHPKGLYVLFFTEMWERFGFYSMLAMFTLYLKDGKQGFGWSSEDATKLYANYLMFVYASPLIGGWIADKKLGYTNSVMLGGFIFIIGYFMLSIRDITAVYAALVCLVVANGFFKPNVSAMVGHQYPEGSKLKDRAYNIFYMGINIGALLAPINAEIWVNKIGYNNAFAIAGFGMIVSVAILWLFKHHLEGARPKLAQEAGSAAPVKQNPIDLVPEARRITALIVIFIIVIVFWMVFHQNGSTLTYWADDNTDWNVSGIIANAINPFWVVTLTFPVVWMWGWLNKRNLEPSTPVKMTFGMFLVGVTFVLLYFAARTGETQEITEDMLRVGDYRITDRALEFLKADGLPEKAIEKLNEKEDGKFVIKGKKFTTDRTFADAFASVKQDLKASGKKQAAEFLEESKIKEGQLPPVSERGPQGNKEFAAALEEVFKGVNEKDLGTDPASILALYKGLEFSGREKLSFALLPMLGPVEGVKYGPLILKRAYLFKVSPLWLILAYAIVTLAELMLSPMGLSLVSKVAPVRLRGLMMGGWFVATAIGNKLTAIGVYWEIWMQSTFFLVLGGMAAGMGVVLVLLLRPLKKAMPGV